MSVCLFVPELLSQFWGEPHKTFCGMFWGPSGCPKVGGRFYKNFNAITILTFDPYEAAPDRDVNTLTGSV